MGKKEKPYCPFREDAKSLVDTFFDKRLFADSVNRDDMNAVEELIEYLLQVRYEGYIKMGELTSRIQKRGEEKHAKSDIVSEMKEVFRWLLGYEEFPTKKAGEKTYYWRTHLRDKLAAIGITITDEE